MSRTRSSKRRSPNFGAAYPGKAARAHKARWLAARDRLAAIRIRPAARACMNALVDRVAKRPHLRDVFVGLGGVKDRRHREALAARAAAGHPPPTPGLAELTGMSRSSMVRARHALEQAGFVRVVVGKGRGNANSFVLRGEPDPLALDLPQPEPVGPDPDVVTRGRALLQEAAQRLRTPRGP